MVGKDYFVWTEEVDEKIVVDSLSGKDWQCEGKHKSSLNRERDTAWRILGGHGDHLRRWGDGGISSCPIWVD
jgi:hypothetical protein